MPRRVFALVPLCLLVSLCLPIAAIAPAWSAQALWLLWVRQGAGGGAAGFEAWRGTHGDEIASRIDGFLRELKEGH